MYCRNCGNLIDSKAEICTRCGCKQKKGTEYCLKCGTRAVPDQAVCARCGYGLNYESFCKSFVADFSKPLCVKKIKPYYQKEFQKIRGSNGRYKGKFNFYAFLLGPIWNLCNPGSGGFWGWLFCILTGGAMWPVVCSYYGFRATYDYYECFMIHETIAAWKLVTGGFE